MTGTQQPEKNRHFGTGALRLGLVCLALAGLAGCDTVGDVFSSSGSNEHRPISTHGNPLTVIECRQPPHNNNATYYQWNEKRFECFSEASLSSGEHDCRCAEHQ